MIGDIYKRESSRVLATLIKLLGDLDLAEDALQDAYTVAIEKWSKEGIPNNPYSWLVSVGRNKAVDIIRREKRGKELYQKIEWIEEYCFDDNIEVVNDDQLKLIFLCCHPKLPLDARIALSLKEVCSLEIERIAEVFLCSCETMRKRLYRAKQSMNKKEISFELPSKEELRERVSAVLHTIYLVFNEGYSNSDRETVICEALMDEAIYLVKLMNKLMPSSETIGLHALFKFQRSRVKARIDNMGNIVTLDKQNRALWNNELINEGLTLLRESILSGDLGSYALQAAIASVHAKASTFSETKWDLIIDYYDMLLLINPSPVIELNHAVAIGHHDGASAALKVLSKLELSKVVNLQSLYSIKAEFLYRNSQLSESKIYFAKALELTTNKAEKSFLNQRLKEIS